MDTTPGTTTQASTTTRALTLAELLSELGVADDGDALPPFWD